MLPANPPRRGGFEPETLPGAISLDDEEDDFDWLYEGWLTRGGYVSLFGPSEVGKSLLMLDRALQMARRGFRVVIFDRENPRKAITKRLRDMKATDADMSFLQVVAFPELPDLATREGAAVLADMVGRAQADVIVLDTISKFSKVGQAAMSDRWTALYNFSIVPLLADGVAVIQIDHTGLTNQDRERDSSAKRDNVHTAYGLMKGSREGVLTMTRAKNRLNYPGDEVVTLHRVTEPVLTHTSGEAVDAEIQAAIRDLRKAGVPLDASRDRAREALKAAGIAMSNDLLGKVLRLWKASDEE